MLTAIAFLTPLPVSSRAPTGRTFLWFPLVGAMIGGFLGLTWRLLYRVTDGSGFVVAVLMVGIDLAITGALHFDGLVDTADGLLAPADRARRLAIMASPEVGAFGMAVGLVTLLLRVACLAQMGPRPLLLVGLWCASRTVMACVAAALPYVRDEGLASAFLDEMPEAIIIGVAGGLLAVFAAAGVGLVGPLAVAAGLVAALGVALLARRRIGGFTGDVLGACGVVCETVGLLVVAAR